MNIIFAKRLQDAFVGLGGFLLFIPKAIKSGTSVKILAALLALSQVWGSFVFNTPIESPLPPESEIVQTQYPTDDIVIADYIATNAPFSAAGNGTIDDTAAIQMAIDTCYAAGGGTVWLPSGTYKVTNTISVYPNVTLRGDWRDPDIAGSCYGTVIKAEPVSGDEGPVLFRIGGSAGIIGLTVYYPQQSATNPIPYNYTFSIPGENWIWNECYWYSSIINCTLLNSYKGIIAGSRDIKSDRASSTLRNVKGTCLKTGAEAYCNGDYSTWEKVSFNNSYWADAGTEYNAPNRATLDSWTRINGEGFVLGDIEWDTFYKISASDYFIGIHTVQGPRPSNPEGQFCAQFSFASIQNCNTALKVDCVDTRWDYEISFLRSVLNGNIGTNPKCIENNTAGVVKLTDCTTQGALTGNVDAVNPGTSIDSYTEISNIPKVTRAVLYNAALSPYDAPHTKSNGDTSLPWVDATDAIQQALDDAGSAGGGVVYLPAGLYRLNGHLTVPANVELRGIFPVHNKDKWVMNGGTYLTAYEGYNTHNPNDAAALITLNGDRAGLSGLRIFYPQNNPALRIVPFPYSVRGNGNDIYVVNVEFINSYNGIDLYTNICQRHFISGLTGLFYNKGIKVGKSTEGWIQNSFSNPNSLWCGIGVQLTPFWWDESETITGEIMAQAVEPVIRLNEQLIILDGSVNEHLFANGSYGANRILTVKNGGSAEFLQSVADWLGGYGIYAESGTSVTMDNFMVCRGTPIYGPVMVRNLSILP